MSSDEVLSFERITTIVKGAFRPFSCKAKVCDYEDKFKFKVLDREGKQLREWRHSLDPLCEMSKLKSLLDDCRAEIEEISGVKLDEWGLT